MIFPTTKKGASLTKNQFPGPLKSLVNSRPQRIFPPSRAKLASHLDKLLFSMKKTFMDKGWRGEKYQDCHCCK
ncbi:hypothetical protein [Chromobacterium subtsugae]|uniref:hypothetical protein n=1 Tax=Chromobacterium subtsugae TaxID=251747 RepID=UPI0012D487F2|nr:hypothetical protein [Chromobacterium subtsugae]